MPEELLVRKLFKRCKPHFFTRPVDFKNLHNLEFEVVFNLILVSFGYSCLNQFEIHRCRWDRIELGPEDLVKDI
jgi:hypothetical protein